MKILVTGASGFVGRALVAHARRSGGWTVHGIGRRCLDEADYTSLDLTKPFDLPFRPDVVVHAAARSSPWGSRADFHRHNVLTTRNVIDFCQRRGHPKLIYVSSSSVFYRHCHQFDLTEESPIGPEFVNLYSETKYAGEQEVRAYPGPSAILRPRAVFGPDDTVLFPRILKAARAGRLPLIEPADGQPAIGDLITVESLANYLLRAAARSEITGDYNLTNNQPVPLIAFLLAIFERLGLPRPSRHVPVKRAFAFAAITEGLYRALPFLGEPPITRFGVSVFAYSKTFDVRKTLAALGPPSQSIADGVDAFVAWQRLQPIA